MIVRAIMGVKSNIPTRGITLRIGARIGSVIWYIKLTNGLVVPVEGAIQETMTLARMET